MKVSEMIKNLQEFMDEHGDLDCYYAVDDEGNDFKPVYYDPSLCYTSEDSEYVYTLEDLEWFPDDPENYTAICVVN